ncbi:MAG TPA: isochorismate synthase [Acidimicrobiales bacterium]|nr:isochorismate synthase [Acidimicrobiales bacterium]
MSAGLHARTVPLAYGPDPLEFDGSPTVLFDRPGLTLVGWGTAQLVEAAEAADALAAIPCDDPVRALGSGPVAFGALPFDDAMRGNLVIPRFTMGIARDAGGRVQRWATAVGPADTPLPDTDQLFDSVLWQYGTTPAAVEKTPGVAGVTTAMSGDGYAAMVRETVSAMAAPDAGLHKVVLSRSIALDLDGQLHLAEVLRRLRAAEPHCTVFSMPVLDGTFFGASPELLVARAADRVSAHPLAGTVARGDTARRDADAQRDLARSDKSQSEHRYVVDAIEEALAPFCVELAIPPEPSLVAFRSVAHLGTRIEGRLTHPPAGVLDLLAPLHPTPAVGGTPRDGALAFQRAHEAGGRGHWAGPVGWVGASGDGEWMIGIRSAQLHEDGTSLTLRAGGGIVAGSEPVAEAAEVDVKLATVLEAILPGASVPLG